MTRTFKENYGLARAFATKFGATGLDVDEAAQEGVIAFWLDSQKFEDNAAYNTFAMKLRIRKHVGRGDVFGGNSKNRCAKVPTGSIYYFDKPDDENGLDQWGTLEDSMAVSDDQILTQIVVRDAIAKLPRRQKEAVVRFHLYGQAQVDAANEMGITKHAFGNMVYRGMQTLKELLG